MASGVCFAYPSFSRGYDLKFQVDAFVIVIDGPEPHRKLPITDVNQMIGRGSRSFGVSFGYVVLINEKLFGTESVLARIHSRSQVRRDDRKAIFR